MNNTVKCKHLSAIGYFINKKEIKNILMVNTWIDQVLSKERLRDWKAVYKTSIGLLEKIDNSKYELFAKKKKSFKWSTSIRIACRFVESIEVLPYEDNQEIDVDEQALGYDVFIEVVNAMFTMYSLLEPFITELEELYAESKSFIENNVPSNIAGFIDNKFDRLTYIRAIRRACDAFREQSPFITLNGISFNSSLDDDIILDAISSVIDVVNVVSAIKNTPLFDEVVDKAVNIGNINRHIYFGMFSMFGHNITPPIDSRESRDLLSSLSHPNIISAINKFILMEKYQYDKDNLNIIFECFDVIRKVQSVDHSIARFYDMNEKPLPINTGKYLKDLCVTINACMSKGHIINSIRFKTGLKK